MHQKSGPLALALSDDLTGTLGLSMLIAKENIAVRAFSAFKDNYDPQIDSDKVIVINTDSRHLSEEDARLTVGAVLDRFPSSTNIVKRFDTTLRGHLGAELSTIMTMRPQAAALIVPSYPESGRCCIGGYQLVEGVPVEHTEAATDPQWPIASSYVPDYFTSAVLSRENATEVKHIPLKVVNSGLEVCHAELKKHARPGAVIVADAGNNSDISTITQAAAKIGQEWIFVSPGAFIAEALGRKLRSEKHRFAVAVIGSNTEQTRVQVCALEGKFKVAYLDLPIETMAQTEKFVQSFIQSWNHQTTDILVIKPERKGVELTQQSPILTCLAQAAFSIISRKKANIAGLILSGGETAMSVLNRLESYSISPEVEFDSLIVGGILLDGPLSGSKIITKGGLVGNRSILLKTMNWLMKE